VYERLATSGLQGTRLSTLNAQHELIESNILAIVGVAQGCYDKPLACPEAVAGLTLEEIDKSAFSLPAVPVASFRLVDVDGTVWSRGRSVAWFSYCYPALGDGGSIPPLSCDFKSRASSTETLSVALQVTGEALEEARLYFEDRHLKTVPLDDPAWPQKLGPDYRLLIVDSVRGNPGWVDFDLDRERAILSVGDDATMRRADGVFYVIVVDGFGRKTRFDIGYQGWNATRGPSDKDQSRVVIASEIIVRNSYWLDESETTFDADGPWTTNNTFQAVLNVPGNTPPEQITDFFALPSLVKDWCFWVPEKMNTCQIAFSYNR
jgi:hypothetical protein